MNTTDHIVYTVDITPVIVGTVTVDINAGVVSDLAGNGNTAATQFSIEYLGSKPEVIISSITTSPTNLSSITLDIVFTESVNGFDESDIQVTNGDVTNLTTTNNINFAVTLLPDIEGEVTAYIPADVATNSIANGNTASNTFAIFYDITAPSVAITSSESSPTNSNSIPLTITFSENVTGFELGDIAVQNGSVSDISNIDNVYSITLIPSGDGIVIVNIASAIANDLAGNTNTSASEFLIIYDGTSPTVTITSTADNTISIPQFTANIQFSEEVNDFVNSDITLGNATLNSLTTTDNILYIATISAINQGIVNVNIAAGVTTDFAGNSNIAASQFTITYDPSVGIDNVDQYQIMIYSNQAEVIIEISNPNNINFQHGQIEIYNIIGVPVLIKKMDNFSKQRIPINNVSTVYIVKLNLDGKVYMKKVFVNR
ncbi:MAG: hypothetical protein A2041_10525 [Bacteroidetes bacterium GWA2_31_9b]|nr:MAG: hypothetical protein A2041_10525 [Bacteroidetes bacterium GWA2_31_9b]